MVVSRAYFSRTIGICNLVHDDRIPFAKGTIGLVSTENMRVDRDGRIVSIKEPTLILAGKFHSLFTAHEGIYAVEDRTDDSAIVFIKEGVKRGIRSGLELGAAVSYVLVEDELFYANNHQNGKVRNYAHYTI